MCVDMNNVPIIYYWTCFCGLHFFQGNTLKIHCVTKSLCCMIITLSFYHINENNFWLAVVQCGLLLYLFFIPNLHSHSYFGEISHMEKLAFTYELIVTIFGFSFYSNSPFHIQHIILFHSYDYCGFFTKYQKGTHQCSTLQVFSTHNMKGVFVVKYILSYTLNSIGNTVA